MSLNCYLVGAPVQSGTNQPGCLMGPDAFRTAGIANTLQQLGHQVNDHGNVVPLEVERPVSANKAVHHLNETVGWALALNEVACAAVERSDFPIFLGGDHSLSIGSVSGVTKAARQNGREQFVLWLDAHPDFHSLETTQSGNLHGTPMAYLTGHSGFEDSYPELTAKVTPGNVCMMGLRSVDGAEKALLADSDVQVFDMRTIDEHGVANPLRTFLDKVKAADGALHVSLDVDFLEPNIAPAVGTTVPGGATFREAHLIMEMLHESDLVKSLDLVELNPFLDNRGRTAKLLVDLTASLFGRRIIDRMTRSF